MIEVFIFVSCNYAFFRVVIYLLTFYILYLFSIIYK
jgi:hypothetical protein